MSLKDRTLIPTMNLRFVTKRLAYVDPFNPGEHLGPPEKVLQQAFRDCDSSKLMWMDVRHEAE